MAARQVGDGKTCHLLECPREIRDKIYAEVLLEFPTPKICEQLDCAMIRDDGPLSKRSGVEYALSRLDNTHKIETNILLTNRQVFSEGREIILRRGRLVQVTLFDVELALRLTSCDLCLIDAKYSSLCTMTHQLHHDPEVNWHSLRPAVFVLCARDIKTFCRAIMGETTFDFHEPLSPTTRQTLGFTTNFHEGNLTPGFLSRHREHRLALQPFRSCLGGFQNVSLQGSSVGLSRVLAATALRDFRSQPVPDPFELLPEVLEMLSLTEELFWAGRSDCYELIAPLQKALWRWTQAPPKWDPWALARRKVEDPTRYFHFYMSGMYTVLVSMFQRIRDYGPWRRGSGVDGDGVPRDFLLDPALQMYEMSLALPKALGCPDWTPDSVLEVQFMSDLSAAVGLLRHKGAEEEYTMGLALGYKAAERIMELAPDEKISQQWMEWYQDWKNQGIKEGEFYLIDDEVMRKRGLKRWSGADPGDLFLLKGE